LAAKQLQINRGKGAHLSPQ